MKNERIAGVVLAAGQSKRLGRPKQLLEWRGRPLIERAARAALDAGLDPVVIVIGHRADDMRAALRAPVTVVENARWAEGMSASLRAGLSALPGDVNAAIMLLVDQPRVDAPLLRTIIDAYRTTGKTIVSPAFRGQRASPTLFDRSLFGELMQITGDEGGRSVVKANPDQVALVDVEDERTVMDVDTLEDWRRMAVNGLETDKRIEADADNR